MTRKTKLFAAAGIVVALFVPRGYLFQGYIPADANETKECMEYVTQHNKKSDETLEYGSSWHKHGKAVVEIRAFDKEEVNKPKGTRMFGSILCVIGNNSVYTLNGLERPFWEQ